MKLLLFFFAAVEFTIFTEGVKVRRFVKHGDSFEAGEGLKCDDLKKTSKKKSTTCQCNSGKTFYPTDERNCYSKKQLRKHAGGCIAPFFTITSQSNHLVNISCSYPSSIRIYVWNLKRLNTTWNDEGHDALHKYITADDLFQVDNRIGNWDGLLLKITFKCPCKSNSTLNCPRCMIIKFSGYRNYPLQQSIKDILQLSTIRQENNNGKDINWAIIGTVITTIIVLLVCITLWIVRKHKRKRKQNIQKEKTVSIYQDLHVVNRPTYGILNKENINTNTGAMATPAHSDVSKQTSNTYEVISNMVDRYKNKSITTHNGDRHNVVITNTSDYEIPDIENIEVTSEQNNDRKEIIHEQCYENTEVLNDEYPYVDLV